MTVLTAAQRTAAIAEVKAAANVGLSTAAAGRIVDRIASSGSPFGNILRADRPAPAGYAGGGYAGAGY